MTGEWIPVSERVPEANTNVLVSCEFVREAWNSWDAMHVAQRRPDGRWIEEVESNEVKVVTHWMPLPARPTE